MYFNMFFITLICVMVIDDSGFIGSVKYALGRFLNVRNYNDIKLSPFDCSYCSSFWCNVIYLLCIGQFSISNICVSLLFSTFTTQIYQLLRFMQDLINIIINKMYEIIE